MTAEEWTASADPQYMLLALDFAGIDTARVPVVLAGAAERGRVGPLLSRDLRQPFATYGRWVFGLSARPLPIELPVFDPLTPQGVGEWDLDDLVRDVMRGVYTDWFRVIPFLRAEAEDYGSRRIPQSVRSRGPNIEQRERRQADALRDALGNPFSPVTWEPSWRSETAVALARGIHFDNAFDRLPILADALEEAGCDHPDILAHCRGPGPHARGCWVVDGVLGKV